ncbi:MAG: phosphatase PAP2 family protein [Clostridia bacterium]|nr:phosphatase PAP2 family protein [Clostridia bacterium]
MAFLRFLEGLRNPVCDALMSAVTLAGDETVFLVVCVVVLWCVCKQEGYYLLSVSLGGVVVNQWLKIVCRVPRPWVQDESFTIVESARAGAGGYSFPSGHAQNAVGIFGGAAAWTKRKAVRAAAVTLAALVCFSRMYLGVHTPQDVVVGAATAIALAAALWPLMKKGDARVNRAVFLALAALSLAYLLYMSLASFPDDTDAVNLASAIKNAYTLFGCGAGILVAHELDARLIHYDTDAVWWAQILKAALGLALLLGLRAGLKPALAALMGGGWADAVRYFLIVVFAGGVWPLTFRFFGRLGR